MSERNKKTNTQVNTLSGNDLVDIQGNKIDKIPIPSRRLRTRQFQGSGEILALIEGKIPSKNVGQVLENLKTKEDNNENERNRQFKAFRLGLRWKYLTGLCIFISIIGFTVYLFNIQKDSTAIHIITHGLAMTGGIISGYGYAKSKK